MLALPSRSCTARLFARSYVRSFVRSFVCSLARSRARFTPRCTPRRRGYVAPAAPPPSPNGSPNSRSLPGTTATWSFLRPTTVNSRLYLPFCSSSVFLFLFFFLSRALPFVVAQPRATAREKRRGWVASSACRAIPSVRSRCERSSRTSSSGVLPLLPLLTPPRVRSSTLVRGGGFATLAD